MGNKYIFICLKQRDKNKEFQAEIKLQDKKIK